MDETSGNIMTAVTGVTETNLVHGERSQRPNSPQEYSLPVEEVKQPRDVTLCSAVSCIQCFFFVCHLSEMLHVTRNVFGEEFSL